MDGRRPDRDTTKGERRDERIRRNPGNVRFSDFVAWMKGNGFELDRVHGSHHVFIHPEKDTPVKCTEKEGWETQNLSGETSNQNH